MKISLSLYLKTIIILIIISTSILLSGGCVDHDFNYSNTSGHAMTFRVNYDSPWTSRSNENDYDDIRLLKTIEVYDETTNDTIYIHAIMSEGISVSANATATRSESSMNTFYADIAVYKDSWDEETTPVNYFRNLTFTDNNNDGVYEPDLACFWPNDDKLKTRIFAYSPQQNEYISVSGVEKPGTPDITFQTPADCDIDLVVADPLEINIEPNMSPSLTFRHVLSGVNFAMSSTSSTMKGTVSGFTIKGIGDKGVYTVVDNERRWVLSDGTKSYYKEIDNNYSEIIPYASKTFGENALIFIPQTLEEGAELSMDFTDFTGTERQIKADISGITLETGKTITFIVGTSKIAIIPVLNLTCEYAGTDSSIKSLLSNMINSSTDNDDNQIEIGLDGMDYPIYFNVESKGYTLYDNIKSSEFDTDVICELLVYDESSGEYVVVDEHPTASLSNESSSDNESNKSSYNRFRFLIDQQVNVAQRGVNSQKLYDAASVGSEDDPYNLAGSDGSETTANCYLVNAPGFYKFPAVYGNSLKDGEDFPDAYTDSEQACAISNSGFRLDNFLSGSGIIKKCWIKDNDSTNDLTVEIVWQDVANMISDVTIMGNDNKYISFRVNKKSIREGNAVIAVKTEETIIWSWHIWVTPIDINKDYVSINGNEILNVNIGWCEPEEVLYKEDKFKLRFTQAYEGNIINTIETSVKFRQEGASYDPQFGTCTRYQWGRKDPMIPYLCTAGNDLPSEDDNKNWTFKRIYPYKSECKSGYVKQVGISRVNESICYPYLILPCVTTRVNWFSIQFYGNLWGGASTTNTKIDLSKDPEKKVYDPCPVGYRVPKMEQIVVSGDYNYKGTENNKCVWEGYDTNNVKGRLEIPYLPVRCEDYGSGAAWLSEQSSCRVISNLWTRHMTGHPVNAIMVLVDEDGNYKISESDDTALNIYKINTLPIRPIKEKE